jgi:predicted naringenin-chalcone synthase
VPDAYLNRIATATPPHDVHEPFVAFGATLLNERRDKLLFERMAKRGQIDHRYSTFRAPECFQDALDGPTVDAEGFFRRGGFPSTAARMKRYEAEAPGLAQEAVERLGPEARAATHVIVTTCTGFSAPGIDLELVERCGLNPSVERTVIGFMGCYAAINALKLARHIVRSDAAAKVLIVSLELCTLHLQETANLEQVLTFLVFGDGCAAALVSAEPTGFRLDRFHAVLLPEAADQITWAIRDLGFDMMLSGQVPGSIATALQKGQAEVLDGADPVAIDLWAVHPGGRSVLDAVETALSLPQGALAASREVLRRYGNMSSATVLFVLAELLQGGRRGKGCAMAFGPGLTAETMLFSAA